MMENRIYNKIYKDIHMYACYIFINSVKESIHEMSKFQQIFITKILCADFKYEIKPCHREATINLLLISDFHKHTVAKIVCKMINPIRNFLHAVSSSCGIENEYKRILNAY
jgi:hypothetical protein